MKYCKISPYGLGMVGVIVVSTIIRLILSSQNYPSTNSDEGTMGLMALHIAYHGALPIFFYGQNYMGALEAYLGAFFFLIFGPSLFALRLGMILLFALFQCALYLLISQLYTKRYALASTALLCLGSPELFSRQLRAVGGALETLLFGTLTLLLATSLILSYQGGQEAASRGRLLCYACLGLVMGLGIWSHMLILPFIAMALLFLFVYCRREWQRRVILCWLAGLLLGLLPLLIYDIQHPLQNALFTLISVYGGTATSLPYTVWDKIRGTVLVSLPMATGASPICPLNSTPGVWRTEISSCMIPQGIWSVGFLLLLGIALWSAWKTSQIQSVLFRRKKIEDTLVEQRRVAARLMLLGSGLLTLCAFVLSSSSALVPITSSRYLVGLEAVLPAVLWPLWYYARPLSRALRSISLSALGLATIGIVIYTFILGTVISFQQVAGVEQYYQQQQQGLVGDLLAMHATRIYTDYWTCDNIAFLSDERIICDVLGNNLQAGQNRYTPYVAQVQQARPVTYVFPVGSEQAKLLAQQMRNTPQKYRRSVVDGYVVYRLV